MITQLPKHMRIRNWKKKRKQKKVDHSFHKDLVGNHKRRISYIAHLKAKKFDHIQEKLHKG